MLRPSADVARLLALAAANHRAAGDNYVGEYAYDKMHGEGVYTFANGEQQKVGRFHEGKFVGGDGKANV